MDTVRSYYARFPEEHRLSSGAAQIEAARTKALIRRYAPEPPAEVLDAGGGAGAYSFWLANQNYDVHLMDVSPRLVELATKRNANARAPLASVGEGDARSLPFADRQVDMVLLLGPLYHLTDAADRRQALSEAIRVLKPGGLLFAACVTRWASLIEGLLHDRLSDERFAVMTRKSLETGQHRNRDLHPEWFTTAYLHRPEEFADELREAGLDVLGVFGIEGPAALFTDFDERWADAARRDAMMNVAEALELESGLYGMSPHLLGVCRV
jgi:ubiquinone/menaquinone biosynthesis C-methylase UbiE